VVKTGKIIKKLCKWLDLHRKHCILFVQIESGGKKMRATTTNLSIRINVETKKEAEEMFDSMGMSLTTAINVFIKQSLRTRSIPFQITMDVPNAVTLAAMQEARQLANDPNAKTYTNVEDALAELKK
jgi:DNA-damage-inducible protein J